MIANKIQKTITALALTLGISSAQANPITYSPAPWQGGPIFGNISSPNNYPYTGPGAPHDLPPIGTMIPGGMSFYATGGDITVTFNGAGSRSYDLISLVAPNQINNFMGQAISWLGETYDLGSFPAGTLLTFSLTGGPQGKTFYTGPGSLNSDGMVHAFVENGTPVGTFVDFQDDINNWDYDDFSFYVTGAVGSVPDGANTLTLLGAGISGLVLISRRLKK